MSESDVTRILIDDARVMLQIVASLIDDSRAINYDRNMFMVQVSEIECLLHQLQILSQVLLVTRVAEHFSIEPGNTNRSGRLSTVDLLIKVPCFAKKGKSNFHYKMQPI